MYTSEDFQLVIRLDFFNQESGVNTHFIDITAYWMRQQEMF